MEIPNPLISDVANGKATLFLGAGASREAGFPTAAELAVHLAKKAGEPHTTKLADQPLDAVAQYLYFERGFGEQWVRDEVISYFATITESVKRPPSTAHELMTMLKWRSIFTTNYDRLIEISYESTRQCVQRYLPFYSSDPQMFQYEPNTIRIIKLNGSVDEAKRNVYHKLVLTFAEQQEAASREKDFYSLLRQEAINGPIIFVGFQFVHPGSTIPGTSPEFVQLQNLLREMGPAARTHYCITPFNSATNYANLACAILKSSKIEVHNATFGDFMQVLSERLEGHYTSLDTRPPIIVPIGQTTFSINADGYENDKRHFDILGDYIEAMQPPSVTDSLNGQETWSSFVNGHFIERACRDNFIEEIERDFQENAEFLCLVAPPGWGKTFLLRDIAIQFYWSSRPIIWLNPYGTMEIATSGRKQIRRGAWDLVRLDGLLSDISELATNVGIEARNALPIVIADNCAERIPEVLALFRTLSRNGRKFLLIFSARDAEFDALLENYPIFRKTRVFQPSIGDESRLDVQKLIDFCSLHHIATFKDESQRELVVQRIIAEGADVALILALQVIFDKEHRPFSEIIFDTWKRLPNEESKNLIIRVAAFHRFGSMFTPRLYPLISSFANHEQSKILELYQSLVRNGDLAEVLIEDEPCVQTRHSLIADQLIRASGFNTDRIEEELFLLLANFRSHRIDLEQMRRLVKQINDYEINLSTDEQTQKLFREAATASDDDWVICQQGAKYLLRRREFELALAWAERAQEDNPEYPPVQHTKGNVLQKWGMHFLNNGDTEGAENKFEEARECFAFSRIEGEPDEYGYVTHLDMLLGLISNERDRIKIDNLVAEGASLYREGLQVVPHDRFNFLLESRFQKTFGLNKEEKKSLTSQLTKAVTLGKASIYAAAFLADVLNQSGDFKTAIEILQQQKGVSQSKAYLWIKEAEIQARNENYTEAALAIDSAKRFSSEIVKPEMKRKMAYWNLLISMALREFSDARTAIQNLGASGLFSKSYPRGYFWKKDTKLVPSKERNFQDHAYIWNGRIKEVKPGGSFGQIEMTSGGDNFYITFNPKYFKRGDFRRGDWIKFVVTFLATGIRADDVESVPFANTVDDLYIA